MVRISSEGSLQEFVRGSPPVTMKFGDVEIQEDNVQDLSGLWTIDDIVRPPQ
jgi:hypothetical protein